MALEQLSLKQLKNLHSFHAKAFSRLPPKSRHQEDNSN
jgi:hypothetical protein